MFQDRSHLSVQCVDWISNSKKTKKTAAARKTLHLPTLNYSQLQIEPSSWPDVSHSETPSLLFPSHFGFFMQSSKLYWIFSVLHSNLFESNYTILIFKKSIYSLICTNKTSSSTVVPLCCFLSSLALPFFLGVKFSKKKKKNQSISTFSQQISKLHLQFIAVFQQKCLHLTFF